MAKFINILAASVGGGILLGAGIRLCEAIVGRDSEARDGMDVRLGALEDRLVNLEAAKPVASDVSRPTGSGADTRTDREGERQAAAVAAIRSELGKEDERLSSLNQVGAQLRVELKGWLEQSVGSRMADVEAKLRAESDEARRQMLDAFAESVQTRVTHRISRLEEEVAGQSAAMAELRDCSLRTEQSLQKLLAGLDRLLVPRPAHARADFSADAGAIAQNGQHAGDSPALQPVASGGKSEFPTEPPAELGRTALSDLESSEEEALSHPAPHELQPRPRRWGLLG